MLWHTFGIEVWFMMVVGATGAIGRGAKAMWSTMPAWALQLLVILCSYLIVFGDLLADGGTPPSDDARIALWGVLLAGGAISGHEVAKKLLVLGLGLFIKDDPGRVLAIAEAILGKLEEQASPPPKMVKRSTTQAFIVLALRVGGLVALVGTLSCTPGQRALAANVLNGVSEGTAWLASAIDVGETGAELYFARHPDPAKLAEVKAFALAAREKQQALDALVALGKDAKDVDIAKAKDAALAAYAPFREALERLGVLDARAPDGGAEAEGVPEPRPISIPTVEELAVRL